MDAATLRELFNYDPDTGLFTRLKRVSQRGLVGTVAGCVNVNGYVHIKIACRGYKAHRLAWLYMTGEWPEHEVDHEDRDRTNNRWKNLRAATHKQNQENRTPRHDSSSGITGVLWSNRDQAWRVTICIEGRKRHIATRKSLEEAAAIRAAAALKYQTHSPYARA